MARSWQRKAIIAAASVASAALLASCGVADLLTRESEKGETSSSTTREPPTQLHPALRDCAPAGSDSELSLTDADLNNVSWGTPKDFYDVTGQYVEDNPVEDLQWMWVGGSKHLPPGTLDVISVNYYNNVAWNAYAEDCQSVPLTAVAERLAQYRTHIGAEALSEPEMIEVSGLPAMKQDLRLDRYDYEGYWIFSTDELLHVYCQWENTSAENEIRRGCKSLIESVRVP